MTAKNDIQDTYVKMEQREHIYKLPDTYIGSVEKAEFEMFIYEEGKMVKKTVNIVPGFYKIFDEILVNAYDQHARLKDEKKKVKLVKEIHVDINDDYISVMNDGEGIDVEIHPEHQIYVPELIFGNLLTSANYEKKNKTTGGKNGIGSKCCNIFSKKFIVETVDGSRKRHYTQVFENNMIIKNEPVIEEDYKEKPFTRITFYPDFERFGMEGMDADILGLLRKRVYDMCACTDKSVSVFLNGEKLDFKNFENYVNLFIGDKSDVKRVYHNDNERWEYCVCLSPDDKFEQVSFVNGIYTFKGGKHVDDLATKISTKLAKFVETKGKKKISLKPSLIRDNMWLFVRSIIEDPSFDSQTKEYLTTVPAKFGSKFQLDDKFIEKVGKVGIVEKAIALTNYKESFNALKNDGKKTSTLRGIPKLDDANWAGTPKSNECTLILTEGDSAKAFAISGLSVIGRDKYGVFPLKGKLLNVRDVEDKKIGDNEEITNLKKIMGLKQSVNYENTNDLRYGSVLILTDADVDGSHIKGLLLNFFHSMWPSLLKINGFVKSMRTPIVKAKKGSDIKVFYTLTDYEEWKETDTKGYEIKYYKGLGTSTSKEAKEYFTELDKNEIRYLWSEDNIVDETVTLAFAKEKADLRKDWLGNYDRKNILKDDENDVNIEDFINKDLIHFSKYDCERSVPSMVDGLKPSQRKVIYGTFLKNSQKELKVAQLAAYVAEHSAYHHGEQSLIGTIIGLAQNFVGSNNINLLEPIGMFGCLSPETEILMWNGKVKQAQEIEVGDELIGDDGYKRYVLETTSGIDDMYSIVNVDGLEMKVNSEHILTLFYLKNFEITWKESSSMWYFYYFDGKKCLLVSIVVNKNISDDDHFNRSKISKEEGYKMIVNEKIKYEKIYGSSKIVDIKIKDYLKLSKFNKRSFYQINNLNSINWERKETLLDPYILGCWLGDGDSNGRGFTSIDKEIIREFVRYCKKINCEVTHHKAKNHDCFHYTIRRKNGGKLPALGSENHCYDNCIGCTSSTTPVNPEICNSKYDNDDDFISNDIIERSIKNNLNSFIELLKSDNLYKNKHIPDNYLFNDKETRLKLLAGFIDTDGTVKNNFTPIASFEISQSKRVHSNLIYSLKFIANSLGYSTSIYESMFEGITKKNESKKMLTLRIFGENLDEVPTLLERKQLRYSGNRKKITKHFTKFTIKHIGKDKFNGFQLDGNERFLLANFTVTHNSRLLGGKDHSSARYIFTKMSDFMKIIFNKDDNVLLNYLDDDGDTIEPEYYVPIIPMVLVNGTEGIGTGFSSSIPSFNPLDIIANLRRKMKGEIMVEMKPWFRGFKGKVEKVDGKYQNKGIFHLKDNGTIEISELPVGRWTDKYKEFLETLMGKKGSVLTSYENHYTESTVKFVLHFDKKEMNKLLTTGKFERFMKLIDTGRTGMTNMHLFNKEGQIKKYNTPVDLMEEFYEIRREMYVKRKDYLENKLQRDLDVISARVRFIKAILDDEIILKGKDEEQLEQELETLEYPKFTKGLLEYNPKEENPNPSYDYLVSMPIRSMTKKRIEDLEKQLDDKNMLYETLKKKSINDLWEEDLTNLETLYEKELERFEKELNSAEKVSGKKKSLRKKK